MHACSYDAAVQQCTLDTRQAAAVMPELVVRTFKWDIYSKRFEAVANERHQVKKMLLNVKKVGVIQCLTWCFSDGQFVFYVAWALMNFYEWEVGISSSKTMIYFSGFMSIFKKKTKYAVKQRAQEKNKP